MYTEINNVQRKQLSSSRLLLVAAMILQMAAIIIGIHPAMVYAAENTVQDSTKINTKKQPQIYIVDKNGMGDFVSIQEGVDNALDGDTLLIYPGTYIEAVQVMNKDIQIVGVSKDLCILQYDTAFYRKIPLTIASGKVSNLTIHGMDSKVQQIGPTQEEIDRMNAELVGDSWERQKNYSGYAVHIDQNCLYGKNMIFENCRIISENNHCVGIGTRGKSKISFENCELISMGGGSCVFMHDPTSIEVSGAAALVMKNSSMTSYLCPYVMTFQSLFPAYNSIDLTFQNVRVSAVAYAESDGYISDNVNTSFEVETLLELEQAGTLYVNGLNTSATALVHEMSPKEANDYMKALEEALDAGDAAKVMAIKLPEGISYIGKIPQDSETDTKTSAPLFSLPKFNTAKHQVIAVYNAGNQPGSGWCGLNNAVLNADSFGNTLVEMNNTIPYTADNAVFPNFGIGY